MFQYLKPRWQPTDVFLIMRRFDWLLGFGFVHQEFVMSAAMCLSTLESVLAAADEQRLNLEKLSEVVQVEVVYFPSRL